MRIAGLQAPNPIHTVRQQLKLMGMDIYGLSPQNKTGEYIRYSVWTWAPLLTVLEQINEVEHLMLNMENWQHNVGRGLRTQEECNRLADALETYIKDNNVVHTLACSMAVSPDGTFLKDDAITAEARSPYQIAPNRIQEFVTFLRSCGGFEIC